MRSGTDTALTAPMEGLALAVDALTKEKDGAASSEAPIRAVVQQHRRQLQTSPTSTTSCRLQCVCETWLRFVALPRSATLLQQLLQEEHHQHHHRHQLQAVVQSSRGMWKKVLPTQARRPTAEEGARTNCHMLRSSSFSMSSTLTSLCNTWRCVAECTEGQHCHQRRSLALFVWRTSLCKGASLHGSATTVYARNACPNTSNPRSKTPRSRRGY